MGFENGIPGFKKPEDGVKKLQEKLNNPILEENNSEVIEKSNFATERLDGESEAEWNTRTVYEYIGDDHKTINVEYGLNEDGSEQVFVLDVWNNNGSEVIGLEDMRVKEGEVIYSDIEDIKEV